MRSSTEEAFRAAKNHGDFWHLLFIGQTDFIYAFYALTQCSPTRVTAYDNLFGSLGAVAKTPEIQSWNILNDVKSPLTMAKILKFDIIKRLPTRRTKITVSGYAEQQMSNSFYI